MGRPRTFRDYNMDEEDAYRYWGRAMSLRPLWALVNDKSILDSEKPAAILKWKNECIEALLDYKEPYIRTQRMNLRLYKGKYYLSEDFFNSLPYNRNKKYNKNHAKIIVPYLHTATEQHVSDLTSYEPALQVVPTKSEEISKVAAKGCKDVLDHYFYEHSLTTQFQRFHRRKKIMGESFYFCLWNPDAGDIHPAYKQLKQIASDTGVDLDSPEPLVDPMTGLPIEGEDGPLFIERPVKTGDIMLVQEFSERVLYPCPDSFLWEDVPYIIRCPVWMDVDEVRARWPKSAERIKPDSHFSTYTSMRAPTLTEKVAVRYLYHPPTTFLDRGFYCVSTETEILEMGDYPFKHNKFPCIRGTDIDLEDDILPMSFYQLLASLAYAINDSTSMILQNQELFARPKWQIPRAAKIRRSELDDDRGIYEYSGPKGAEILATNSTPNDTWKWRDTIRDEFQTHSAIFATSRGRGVDGITANVALRLIDEQERKMHKPAIDKHADNCVDFGTMILSVLGTYRDPTDGMLIKILGKNNQRMIRAFDVANLDQGWEVTLAKSSALPESPAAKAQLVLDYSERWPTLWEEEEVLEMLDMQRPERLVESATISRQTAESEVEDILQGYDVPPPSQYVDVLPRYKVYVKAMQTRDFDDKPPPIKNRLINHVITAEYLIMRKMANPVYAEKVMTEHPYFPLFMPEAKTAPQPYQLATGTPSPMAMPMDASGAAPLGGMPPEVQTSAPTPPPQGTAPEPQSPPESPQTIPDAGALPQQDAAPSPSLP